MSIPIDTATVPTDALLTSFPENLNAVVVGATGGIGAALVEALAAAPRVGRVLALARRPDAGGGKVATGAIDVADADSIAAAAERAARDLGAVHLVVVASGVLHGDGMAPEKTYRRVEAEALARAFAVNATGPMLVARHFAPLMPRQGKTAIAAVSARVGSIADNRLGGWYAYRASKAALNQLLRTFAIELARKHPDAVALALHPGTTDTALSAPFQGNVAAAKLFTPAYAANRLLQVIDAATPAESGRLVAWNGELLPY